MRALRNAVCALLILTTGCGEASPPRQGAVSRPTAVLAEAAPAAARAEPAQAGAPAALPALERKIIYNAEIGLIVEDFTQVEPEITRLVQQAQGYIAELNVLGSPGSPRSARWRVRVPVAAFEDFLRDIARLGELESNRRTSEDVSEQFYDLEARIKNKKIEEERLVQILKETTGKIEDVLQVEKELSRVRGEIEQMEGRLRVLQDLTALTTVTISIRERQKFQPPPPAAADFPTMVARTFQSSLNRLVDFGKSLALVVVAVIPWLPLIALGALVLWGLKRRLVRPRPVV